MAAQSDYVSGTISLTNGEVAFTGAGTGWLLALFKEGDTIIDITGATDFMGVIATIDSNGAGTLTKPWEGPDLVDVAYRMRYQPDGARVSAQARNLIELLGNGTLLSMAGLQGPGIIELLAGGGARVVPKSDLISGVDYDITVNTLAGRAAYDAMPGPTTDRRGFSVIVAETGSLYSKRSDASGDWSEGVLLTGPGITLEVTDVDEVPYGTPPDVTLTPVAGGYQIAFEIPRGMIIEPGETTTLAPDQPAEVTFVPITGGYRLDIAIPRGPTGDITGVTPFWNMRLGSDADEASAREGIGAGVVDAVMEGDGVEIDATDPQRPVLSLSAFGGDAGAGGVKGAVPAPAAGDAAARKFLSASGGWESIPGGAALFNLSPLYLEQIITGFHGRGMLAAESNDALTETTVSADASAGDNTVTLTAASQVLAGSNVTIEHDNGKYWTYWVFSNAGSVLTLMPSLKWDVSAGCKAERTWYNRAHAGKFYMRQLAQRLVDTDSLNMQMPAKGRAFFTQFITGAGDDALTAFGSAAVNYFDATSVNGEGATHPPRFLNRRTAFASIPGPGSGAYSAMKTVVAGASYIARIVVRNDNPLAQLAIKVMAATDPVRELASEVFTGNDSLVVNILTIPFRMPANATSVYIRFDNLVASAGNLSISQIEIFEAEALRGNVLRQNSDLRVVVCGDSWASGDISNAERESFATQLAIELPNATVINKGGGGSTIWENLPNFQTIVADENPDVVILHTGVNEAYTPFSGTFVPNAVAAFADHMSQFLGKCMAIGAKPIIIGTPALAEADAGSGYSAWTLNDRAGVQAAWAYQNL